MTKKIEKAIINDIVETATTDKEIKLDIPHSIKYINLLKNEKKIKIISASGKEF